MPRGKKAIEIYTVLTDNEEGPDTEDTFPEGGYSEKELSDILDAVVQKAILRSHVTEFRSGTDPDEGLLDDEVEPSELDIEKEDEIYVYTYEISTTEEEKKSTGGNGGSDDDNGHGHGHRGPLSSVYTMHLDESGVPVCSCPEIARGGPICHHMVIHATEVGPAVSVESD